MLADGAKMGESRKALFISAIINHTACASFQFPSREVGRCVHLSPKDVCNVIQNGVVFRPCNPKIV